MKSYQIGTNDADQRFDKYLKKLLHQAPGSFVYKMLRKKNITLNGKKADGTERLKAGDEVTLFFSDETFDKFSGGKQADLEFQALLHLPSRKLPVVYEDTDVLIVNKPSGMLSQKAESADLSANEYILSYLIAEGTLTEEEFRTFRPSVCNRLDRNTSGLLAAGKTLKGLQVLSRAFKERTVQKYYRCIVKGEMKTDCYLKGFLCKDTVKNKVVILNENPDEGSSETGYEDVRYIETEYHPLIAKHGYSELEVHLITGRSHQIRAHLASVGCPIAGDFKYGDAAVNEALKKGAGIRSQLLHAYRMEFEDGRTVTAPCPAEFEAAWNYIKAHAGK